jgi:elongator complex protein 5
VPLPYTHEGRFHPSILHVILMRTSGKPVTTAGAILYDPDSADDIDDDDPDEDLDI